MALTSWPNRLIGDNSGVHFQSFVYLDNAGMCQLR